MSLRTPVLSVVVPVFNEAGNLAPLCAEIQAVMGQLTEDYEIIVVNDGSRDGTLEEGRSLLSDPRLRLVDLDGHFGRAPALSAGFHAARARLVVTLDGDGQNDPHDIPRVLALLTEGQRLAVSGWRKKRQASRLTRVLPSLVANTLIAAVSGVPIHDAGCGLKAYRREVVGRVQLPRGLHRFLPAILGLRSSEVAEVAVHDRPRQHGTSHYGLGRAPIVLRDLLGLRFLMADPQRFEAVFARLSRLASLGAATLLLHGSTGGGLVGAVLTGLVALVWWSLRRFNRAQRDGVYRVRCEYTQEMGLVAGLPMARSGSGTRRGPTR